MVACVGPQYQKAIRVKSYLTCNNSWPTTKCFTLHIKPWTRQITIAWHCIWSIVMGIILNETLGIFNQEKPSALEEEENFNSIQLRMEP